MKTYGKRKLERTKPSSQQTPFGPLQVMQRLIHRPILNMVAKTQGGEMMTRLMTMHNK